MLFSQVVTCLHYFNVRRLELFFDGKKEKICTRKNTLTCKFGLHYKDQKAPFISLFVGITYSTSKFSMLHTLPWLFNSKAQILNASPTVSFDC